MKIILAIISEQLIVRFMLPTCDCNDIILTQQYNNEIIRWQNVQAMLQIMR